MIVILDSGGKIVKRYICESQLGGLLMSLQNLEKQIKTVKDEIERLKDELNRDEIAD